MKCIKHLLFIAVLLTSFATFSQNDPEEEKLSLEEGTIDNQFEYVIRRSNNYQDFKVVKKVIIPLIHSILEFFELLGDT